MKTLPQFAAFVPVLLNTLFNFVKLLVLRVMSVGHCCSGERCGLWDSCLQVYFCKLKFYAHFFENLNCYTVIFAFVYLHFETELDAC